MSLSNQNEMTEEELSEKLDYINSLDKKSIRKKIKQTEKEIFRKEE